MPDASELAVSFGGVAQDYDRYRMGPPARALDWLLPADCASVLDLGAGTGLLTRRLVDRVEEVVAVEPDTRMREVLADRCPRAAVLEGTAEHIPLPRSRVDAVMVSAAWHWMDPARALPEIARVLKPGGTLGVLWTRRDRRVPWIDGLDTFVRDQLGADDKVERLIQRMNSGPWLPAGAPFAGVTSHVVTWTAEVTCDDVVAMFATYSRFIALSPVRRRDLASRIEARVRDTAEMLDGVVRMPMACHCWRMYRTSP
jgi:SAM-dependent methyltransferase